MGERLADGEGTDGRQESIVSGVLFVGVGLSVMWLAGNYSPETTARMGPGYFPRLLGGVLALLGVIITAQAVWQKTPDGQEAPSPTSRWKSPSSGRSSKRPTSDWISVA